MLNSMFCVRVMEILYSRVRLDCKDCFAIRQDLRVEDKYQFEYLTIKYKIL